MDNETLIQKISEKIDCDNEQVKLIMNGFYECLKESFVNGETVCLDETIGRFEVKRSESHLNENSPRTLKMPKYKVCFKASRTLKKSLKLTRADG